LSGCTDFRILFLESDYILITPTIPFSLVGVCMDELWDEAQLLLRWAPGCVWLPIFRIHGIGYAVHGL